MFQLMRLLNLLNFCIVLIHFLSLCIGSIRNDVIILDIAPRKIRTFTHYDSMRIFHWILAPQYKEYIFQFTAFVNQTDFEIGTQCNDSLAQIIIRSNAIPLPNPKNWKTPSNVIIQNDAGVVYSGQFLISQNSNILSRDVTIMLNSSSNIHYFVASYLLPDFVDERTAVFDKRCQYKIGMKILASQALDNINCPPCFPPPPPSDPPAALLSRVQHGGIFGYNFLLNSTEEKFNISFNDSQSFKWQIFPVKDSGATVRITLTTFSSPDFDKRLSDIRVVGSLKHPSMNDLNHDSSLLVVENATSGNSSFWEVPFPLSGWWVLTVGLGCASGTCPNVTQAVQLSIAIRRCPNNCSLKGICLHHLADYEALFISACHCQLGMQGIDCSERTMMTTHEIELKHTLLLTLSNAAFLPCTVLAAYQKYFIEAFLYFALCFFSTFYHACDQASTVKLCILPYETLQYGDFLFSISSLWFTLLTISVLPEKTLSFLQVFGIMLLSIVVSYDRFSKLAFLIPFAVGFLITIDGWWMKSKEIKCVYPGKKNLLYLGLPALLCAFTSLCLNTFVQTSNNYFIVHSLWHVLLGVAMFLLLCLKISAAGICVSSEADRTRIVDDEDQHDRVSARESKRKRSPYGLLIRCFDVFTSRHKKGKIE